MLSACLTLFSFMLLLKLFYFLFSDIIIFFITAVCHNCFQIVLINDICYVFVLNFSLKYLFWILCSLLNFRFPYGLRKHIFGDFSVKFIAYIKPFAAVTFLSV